LVGVAAHNDVATCLGYFRPQVRELLLTVSFTGQNIDGQSQLLSQLSCPDRVVRVIRVVQSPDHHDERGLLLGADGHAHCQQQDQGHQNDYQPLSLHS
jgi:hypothetical protein